MNPRAHTEPGQRRRSTERRPIPVRIYLSSACEESFQSLREEYVCQQPLGEGLPPRQVSRSLPSFFDLTRFRSLPRSLRNAGLTQAVQCTIGTDGAIGTD